jgi:hypothetical protein
VQGHGFIAEYIRAAGMAGDDKAPLFSCAVRRTSTLAATAMHRVNAWRMIQRRASELGMKVKIGCRTFRATGIAAYLEAGGALENAQAMAAHESPHTTKPYDPTGDGITLDEVERINGRKRGKVAMFAWAIFLSWAIAIATYPCPAFSEPVPIRSDSTQESSDLPSHYVGGARARRADSALWIGTKRPARYGCRIPTSARGSG